ncbi:MAG: redox-regulated ATPase YchF [Thermoprotei archaeon]
MLIGLVGKTNVGKSTFFSASTMVDVEIANRPFTTIKPHQGIGYVRSRCVHNEFSVKDEVCRNGTRLIPVTLLDIAGLVPGAHEGKGLGNKFLDDIRQADVHIHVVDASGSTDPQGRHVGPGAYDPLDDVRFLENELDVWLVDVLKRDWYKVSKPVAQSSTETVSSVIHSRLTGLGYSKEAVEASLNAAGLEAKKPADWAGEDFTVFAKKLRKIGKPSVIAANKADLPSADENIERMKREVDQPVVPVVAEAELALRKASARGLIEYFPGDAQFRVTASSLPAEKEQALRRLSTILEKHGGTGVQQTLEAAVFDAYKAIVVYPVEDLARLSDKNGRVLPDAHILKAGSTPKDLARLVHSDLAENYQYSVDARTKQRLAADYILKDRDVLKIVAQ